MPKLPLEVLYNILDHVPVKENRQLLLVSSAFYEAVSERIYRDLTVYADCLDTLLYLPFLGEVVSIEREIEVAEKVKTLTILQEWATEPMSSIEWERGLQYVLKSCRNLVTLRIPRMGSFYVSPSFQHALLECFNLTHLHLGTFSNKRCMLPVCVSFHRILPSMQAVRILSIADLNILTFLVLCEKSWLKNVHTLSIRNRDELQCLDHLDLLLPLSEDGCYVQHLKFIVTWETRWDLLEKLLTSKPLMQELISLDIKEVYAGSGEEELLRDVLPQLDSLRSFVTDVDLGNPYHLRLPTRLQYLGLFTQLVHPWDLLYFLEKGLFKGLQVLEYTVDKSFVDDDPEGIHLADWLDDYLFEDDHGRWLPSDLMMEQLRNAAAGHGILFNPYCKDGIILRI